MKQSFRLYLKPISVNSFYTGNRQFKSAAARDWTLEAFNQINQPSIIEKLKRLREHFDPLKHTYEIEIRFAYPSDKLYTKKGDISSKSIDLTNCEKSIVDILFLSKFYEDIQNLNIDDRYLMRLVSEKIKSENDEYYMEISIKTNLL